MSSQTAVAGSQDDTAAGKVILMIVSPLSALLVLLGLIYALGAGGRHNAAVAASDCVRSLYISSLPCITEQMLVSDWGAIVNPANKLLSADMAAYDANERSDLVAAEAALTSEVATEQSLDNNLEAATFTPQNRANTLAQLTNSASNGLNVPLSAVTFTPQITVMVNALVQADQARAKLLAEQARATSLTRLRSFNHRAEVASTAIQAQMRLIRQAVASAQDT
jgi:hypothetical protein